ncbi:MAG: hypothetical protein WC358_00575 [Ignavibacteria bacterium]
MRKAVSYLEAKFGGESLPDIQMQRLAKCFSCEWMLTERRNSSGNLDAAGNPVENPYYYCKKCGCPKTRFWPDSELRKKVTFDKAVCPLSKWDR